MKEAQIELIELIKSLNLNPDIERDIFIRVAMLASMSYSQGARDHEAEATN